MKKKLTPVYVLFWVMLSYLFISNSGNPPNGHTGAPPAGTTCASSTGGCHSGGTGSGDVMVSGLPSTITTNTMYPITVTVNRTNAVPLLGGFQMVVLDASNQNAGTLSNPGASSTIQSSGGRTYFEHNPVLPFGGGNTVTYTVNWTAPASGSGVITMYAAGNLANGNGNNSGDAIVTTTSFGTLTGGGGAITVTVSSTNVSCFGGSNGTATAMPSGGGGPPYTYAWSNGGNTQTISNLVAGTYMVTVTNGAGGNGTGSVTITQPPLLSNNIVSQTNISCTNPVGAATAQGTGGVGGYTYNWSNGSTGPTGVFINPGNYTVTVSDGNACTATASVNITGNTTPPAAEAGPAMQITCINATVTLNGTGSSAGGNFTYLWTTTGGQIINGANTLMPVVGAAGTYTLTVTNTTNGCTSSDNTTVTSNTAIPTSNAGSDMLLTCTTTSAQLNGSGSSAGANFSYLWTTTNGNIVSGATTLTPTVNAAGTYCLRVTNNTNGCTSNDCANVSQNTAPPVANAGSASSLNCSVSSVTLNGSGSSSGANFSYLWTTANGNIVSGANTTMPVVNAAGTYTLTVTNSTNGCTASASVTVTSNTTPPTASAGPGMALNCNSSTVVLNGSGSSSGANFSYLWTTANGNIVSGANTTMPVVNAAGTYTLTVTNSTNGCTASASVTVTSNTTPPTASAGPGMALNCNSSTVVLNGSGSSSGANFSYLWTTANGNIVSGANTTMPVVNAAGTYTLTVTNNTNTCTATSSTTVTQTPALSASISAQTNVLCNGTNTGSATAAGTGGNGSYTFAWSNSSTNATANNLAAGTYTVTITDANVCTATASVTITAPPALNANASATGETSVGANDGTATALPTGGVPTYTWSWSNSATTQTITGLVPGSYTVTVTDDNGCTSAQTVTVNSFSCSSISLGFSSTNPSCNGGSNGSSTVTPAGGATPYTFIWSNGGTNATINGLAAGTYSVSATDDNGCEVIGNVTITAPPVLSVAVSQKTNVSCNGGSNGSATASSSGGTPGYTYAWSNSGTGASQMNLAAGTYTVTSTDNNGCTATTQVSITQPPALGGIVTATSETAVNANDGTASASVNGGVPGYTYEWNNGETAPSINNLSPGQYCVTATDVNGCTYTGCATVSSFGCAAASATITPQHISCFGENDGTATVAASGLTEPVSYLWSNNGTGATISGLSAGTFSVTLTAANGCTATAQTDIEEPDALAVGTSSQTNIECAGQTTGAVSVQANGGTPGYSFAWSNGDTGPNVSNLAAGNYDVTTTDANGCTATLQVEITVIPDTEPPVVLTQNITLSLDIDGKAAITAGMIDAGSTDNCGMVNLSVNTSQFDCDDIGMNEVILTVTDAANNSSQESAFVTVVDDLAPLILCPPNMVITGGCNLVVQYPEPTATDNCSVVVPSLVSGLPSGSVFPQGTTAITWTAKDQHGNSTSCTFNISVVTDLDGTITAKEPSCNGLTDGTATAVPTGGVASFSFQWDDPMLQTTATAGNLAAGAYTVVITDASGCEKTITVDIGEPDPILIAVNQVTPETNANMNGAISITVGGGAGGQLLTMWFLNGLLFSEEEDLTGLSAGEYALQVTDATGCTAVDTILVDNMTATNEPGLDNRITLRPNPTPGMLYIQFDLPAATEVNIAIMDLTGRQVQSELKEVITAKTFTLDLSNQASGIYILRLVVNEAVVVRRVVLSR